MELALPAEARDDGLGACEAQMGVLIGELRDQTAKASECWELRGLRVCKPGFLSFSLTEKC